MVQMNVACYAVVRKYSAIVQPLCDNNFRLLNMCPKAIQGWLEKIVSLLYLQQVQIGDYRSGRTEQRQERKGSTPVISLHIFRSASPWQCRRTIHGLTLIWKHWYVKPGSSPCT